MSISAISSASAGVQRAMQSFDSGAAQVAVATAPRAQSARPPAAPLPQMSLEEAQATILAAHSAVQLNTASLSSATQAYGDSIRLLSGG